MRTFLKAFCLGLAIGVPVALCTWSVCCTTWTLRVAYRAQQPQAVFELKL